MSNMNPGLAASWQGDTVKLTTKCAMCGKVSSREVPADRWAAFEEFDGHVQDFWPDWSAADREHFFMPGGTCDDCWKQMFPPDDECGDCDKSLFEPTEIEYGGKKYPAVNMYVEGFGERLVSVESLEKELIARDGAPVNEEAGRVDDEIFFYVADDVMDKGADAVRDCICKDIT